MKKTVLFTLATLFFTAVAINSNAQTGPRVQVENKGADVSASRGHNSNIKGERPASDTPAEAGSRGSGSGTCYIYLHNYTSYSIDIYVDGYWKGTLGAYADSYTPTGTGYTSVYGLSIGKTKEWVFSGASCNSSYDYYFK